MNDDWETRVQNLAKGFSYPPTPDIAADMRKRLRTERHPRWRQRDSAARHRVAVRRVAQIAAIFVLVLVGLLAVPEICAQVIAQVIALLRIGAVQVVVTTATPPARFSSSGDLPSSVLDFPGATTLEDAEQHVAYSIHLPAALAAPDRVYLIAANQPVVVLAWLDDQGGVDSSLHLLPPGTYALKMTEGVLEETEVNGARALWLDRPHWYMLKTSPSSEQMQMRSVEAHALIWEAPDGMTYRLETERPLDDALRIANSIPTSGNG